MSDKSQELRARRSAVPNIARHLYRAAATICAHAETFWVMEARRSLMQSEYEASSVGSNVDGELAAAARWRARRIRWAGRADGLVSMATYAPAALDANGAEVSHA